MKVISGKFGSKEGVIQAVWPVSYLDFLFSGPDSTEINVPANHNSMLYIYEGALEINEKLFPEGTAVVFDNEDQDNKILLTSSEKQTSKAIFISGLPINEEVVQQGPFVLNTKKELHQTFEDYSQRKNGFENAKNWSSEIQNLKNKK